MNNPTMIGVGGLPSGFGRGHVTVARAGRGHCEVTFTAPPNGMDRVTAHITTEEAAGIVTDLNNFGAEGIDGDTQVYRLDYHGSWVVSPLTAGTLSLRSVTLRHPRRQDIGCVEVCLAFTRQEAIRVAEALADAVG